MWNSDNEMKQDIRNESNALRSAFGAHSLVQAAERLAPWFRENARSMPWRDSPTAYHVWVSEIMLQQTRVDTVIPYYGRFIDALPDTAALSACSEDRLLKLWEGLGYYSRVRNLQKAARIVEETYGGRIPETKEELLALPGIGLYTAGAILSIAYEQPVPVVDGNVLRVVSRILCDPSDSSLPETKDTYYALLEETVKEAASGISPRIFNQSLMELGALVCVPNGEPKCTECPVREICTARLLERTSEIPVRTPKKARKTREITVLVIFDGTYRMLVKNSEKGLLSRLYGYPVLPGHASCEASRKAAAEWGFSVTEMIPLPERKHFFTHVEWHMTAWLVRVMPGSPYCTDGPDSPGLYEGLIPADRKALESEFALPSAFRRWDDELKELIGE